MTDSYKLEIAGLTRQLPIRDLGNGNRIAFFQLLGDLELCEAIADQFVRQVSAPCDFILAPELKSIPLAHELARALKVPYIILRKARKPYMASAISVPARSFTSNTISELWLDADDAQRIHGKNVWIVDDVLTTGSTLRAATTLASKAGAAVTSSLVVLKEGATAAEHADVVSLGELPILPSRRGRPSRRAKFDRFHHRALDLRDSWPIVYTALSKHQFCYRVFISKFVLEHRNLPFNPAMNFDFAFHGLVEKDGVVTGNNNAIRMADEVWVFGPVSDGVLAEVMIAEDLGRPVKYFKISAPWLIEEIDESECEYEADLFPQLWP